MGEVLMETWKNQNGADLPPGPWSDEPDKAVWVDEATNFDCMIHRNRMGALCGYVGVGSDHPLHGEGYDVPDVEVHGGLTYANACQETEDPSEGICHVAQPGRPDDVWWFGFDCAHFQDYLPWRQKREAVEVLGESPAFGEQYRTFEYVKAEVESLAKQLAAAA